MNRQRLVLACLAAVLALSLLYAFWAMPRQEKAPPRPVTATPAVGPAKAGKPAPVRKTEKPARAPADRLLLDLLNREPQAFPGAGRDIFHLGGRVLAVVEAEPVKVEPPPEPPKPPPTPEEILKGSLKDIIFLGFLDKGGKRTVFLNSGGEVFLVKAGERFGKEKELIAREITAKHLVVGWVDGPETVKVQLLENEKLQPATISGGAVGRVPSTISGGVSSKPVITAPRRRLLPQRAPSVPPAEELPPGEQLPEGNQPPPENISQEELLKQGLPSGE